MPHDGLPPTIPVQVAARLLGISPASGYRAIKTGTFPAPANKVGGRYVIPTRPLLDYLGLDALPAWAVDAVDDSQPVA